MEGEEAGLSSVPVPRLDRQGAEARGTILGRAPAAAP